jgi:hypothetical protein
MYRDESQHPTGVGPEREANDHDANTHRPLDKSQWPSATANNENPATNHQQRITNNQ